MSFDLPDKVAWENLAPSLQALFNDAQDQLIALEKYIKGLTPGKGDSRIDDCINNGLDGQVVKVNATAQTLFADDDFRNIKVVVNDTELNDEMNYKPIAMKTVFNSWYRYTHAYGPAIKDILDHTNWNQCADGQNVLSDKEHADYLDPNKDGWVYNEAEQSISSHYDYEPVAGFINPNNFYTNYFLRVKVDTGWDDDNLMIIAGYMKDSNGVEHTLSLVRGAGNIKPGYGNPVYGAEKYAQYNGCIDTTFWWGLIYDMGNPTQHILINKSEDTGPSKFRTDETRHCIAYITLIRTNSHLECRTTDWTVDGSDKKDVDDWTFTWDIPKSASESSMPSEEYNNIKVMLEQTNRVGFGVRSGQPIFSIDSQHEIFDDGDIYALHTDKVYTYNTVTSNWEVKGTVHDILPNRIFLYNSRIKTFYFYNYWNKWCKIKF